MLWPRGCLGLRWWYSIVCLQYLSCDVFAKTNPGKLIICPSTLLSSYSPRTLLVLSSYSPRTLLVLSSYSTLLSSYSPQILHYSPRILYSYSPRTLQYSPRTILVLPSYSTVLSSYSTRTLLIYSTLYSPRPRTLLVLYIM